MTTTLEQANAALKAAVHERLGNTPADDPKMVGYSPLTEPRQVVASTEETQHDESDAPYAETMNAAAKHVEAAYESYALRGDSVLSDTYAEWEPGFRPVSPAEQTLRDAIATIRDRHGKYGPPTEHFQRTASLVNAAFGTTFTPADWALVMVLDKIARQMGPAATDDAAIDIAGYAACHQECRRA
jgi:hypothetical protein